MSAALVRRSFTVSSKGRNKVEAYSRKNWIDKPSSKKGNLKMKKQKKVKTSSLRLAMRADFRRAKNSSLRSRSSNRKRKSKNKPWVTEMSKEESSTRRSK